MIIKEIRRPTRSEMKCNEGRTNHIIVLKCDYCGKVYERRYDKRIKEKEKHFDTLGCYRKSPKSYKTRSYKIDDEEFIRVCKESTSMRQAGLILGIPHTSFKRIAKRLGVYNTNQGWNKGKILTSESEIFTEGQKTSGRDRSLIKRAMINLKGVKEECNECGIESWMDKEITLELHHVDKNKTNNKIENLRLLCRNCHIQIHRPRREKDIECNECGVREYNGKGITLEKHHKDGDRKNNTSENLMMLCPNCHGQTNNFRGKLNTGKRKYTEDQLVRVYNESDNIRQVCLGLGISCGGNYRVVRDRLNKLGLSF